MGVKSAVIACGLLAAVPVGASAAIASTPFSEVVGRAKAAMMADPDKALAEARSASRIAASFPDARARMLGRARAAWLEAEALSRINRVDEAEPIIRAARETVARHDPGSKLHGDLLMTGAAIEGMTGDVRQALTDLQEAHRIFVRLGDARAQSIALQEIGTIYLDARDYSRMLKYYAQATEAYDGDPNLSLSAYNNQASALEEMGRHQEAIAFFRKALTVARSIGGVALETRVLTNLAGATLNAGDASRAGAILDRAFAVAKGKDAGWEPFMWGARARVAMAQGRPEKARANLERTFAGLDPTQTDTQFRELHQVAARVYEAVGDPAKALVHLTAFKRLDDEMREIAVSTNAGLMTARFDFANQELAIARLKAGQLQRDIALERSKARLSQFTLYGLIAALVLAGLVLAGAFWSLFSVRRSRNDVAQANRKLSSVNVELETALAAKTRFLATTSHEIRTPLNGILGMTQVMLHDRNLHGPHRDRIRVVHDAGETMKALVDDILDVAKIETGTVTIHRSDIPLRAVLEGVARTWADQAKAKGLVLEVDLARCPERVMGDERRFRQIVFNLLSNAIKFTERGTVSLEAAMEGGILALCVRDTGIGIPEDQLGAVFASFHQVDGGTTRRHGGTGLGLSICDELVRAMGGAVTLESELGVGSSFTVRLPVEAPVGAAGSPDETPWPDDLAAARLLVVEDNPLARSIMAAVLTPLVGELVMSGSAEARAIATGKRFHHAVVDCTALGRIDEPAGLLGHLARGGAVTLLASADADPELGAGADRLLRRPIAPAALADALRQAHRVRTAPDAPALTQDAA